MKYLKRLLRNTPLMLVAIFCAFIVAALAGQRLRYAPVFKPLFSPTCITLGEGEVIPTLAVFLLASASVIAGIVNVVMRSRAIRGLAVGLLVASLAFGIGLLANSAI